MKNLSWAICSEIENDLQRGVFDAFPKIKSRMKYLLFKITMSKYVLNSAYLLSDIDFEFLEDQGYESFIIN